MAYEGSGTIQEMDDDGPEIIARNSAEPGGEVEGFSEDFSQMLRAHFREKLKMKKAITNGHVVTFSFVVSVSTPLSADRMVELEAKAAKKKTQGGIQGPVDPSVAIAHIHTEYAVLPGDTPMKTDVIFYATAARVFPDRHEPKTVRTWWADGHLWCSWTHSHSVHVTDALLRRLANHAIELRIWDSREKLSQRARLDRPRGFRASDLEGQPPSGMGYSVTSMLGIAGGIVITQAKLYSQEQSRQVLFTRPFTQTIRKHAISTHKSEGQQTSHGGTAGHTASPTPTESKNSDNQANKVIPEPGNQLRDYSQLGRTANASADFEEVVRRKRLAVAYRHGQAANIAMLHQGAIGIEKQENANKHGSNIHSLAKRIRPSPNNPGDTGSRQDLSNNSDISNARGLGTDLRSSMASVATTTGNITNNLPQASQVIQSVRLRTATLYDGRKSTTCRILQPLGLVSDCLMTLIVDPSLLSESQMIKFKPVMLRIASAGPLPPGFVAANAVYCRCLLPDLSPTPADASAAENDPKSAQFKAVDEILNKEKIAQQQQQEADLISVTELMQPLSNNTVYWNHSIVLLTGDIPDDALRQNLLQRPLFVELHDREEPQPAANQQSIGASTTTLNSTASAPAMKPAVFGTLPNDSQIASTAVLPPPPPEPPKPPYGVAEFSLNDLLISPTGKGISFSQGSSVVRPKRPLQTANTAESSVKKVPLPRYLECGTVMKVSARVPIPLFTAVVPKAEVVEPVPSVSSKTSKSHSAAASLSKTPVPATPEPVLLPSQCVSTLVIVLPAQVISLETSDRRIDIQLTEMIKSTAVDANSDALSLSGIIAPEERAAALTAYQLAPAQQIDKTLNLVTGFHLVDEDGVLLVVEGSGEVIAPLWENSMAQVRDFESANKKTDNKITILYNSSLSSPVRRYGALDLSFGTITLGRGISKIVAEPLLYIRDMAPANCRAAAVKLAELRTNTTSLADIFRRALLPTSLELRSLNDEFAVKASTQPTPSLSKQETALFVPKEATHVDDDYDRNYSSDNEEIRHRVRNFLRENVEEIWQESEKNRLIHEQTETISVAVNTGHVYSSHTVNAVEIAKAHIREHMLSPDQRYTFSQFYHHRTMTPRSASPERFSMYPHARHWQFPGHIDAIQANQHPKMPDKARREEISQPWRENWLHEKYLQPPLVERGPMPWEMRKADLNLYEHPEKEKIKWSIFKPGEGTAFTIDALPPMSERRLHVYRRGVRSELQDLSSKLSLLDRVADVLHDPPKKLALKFRPVGEIPKISMLADDPPAKNEKCKPFGPVNYNDWLLNRNIIALKSSVF